jgi:hypothetical protein
VTVSRIEQHGAPASSRRASNTARAVSAISITLLLVACGPVPGGKLDGTVAAPPSDWAGLLEGGRDICEIESRPSSPHSIQLDCFLHKGHLYVQSHRWVFASWWPVESWASIWIAQPDVLVRIDSKLFALRAVHVTNSAERTPILESRGYDPPPEGIAVFRFDKRS